MGLGLIALFWPLIQTALARLLQRPRTALYERWVPLLGLVAAQYLKFGENTQELPGTENLEYCIPPV